MNLLPIYAVEGITPVYISVLMLMGGLGALLVGMRMLQLATEKLATSGLKNLFAKTANSKLAGVGIGTLATMIMQSSGATTVMVVGFVNAGVMTLTQAVSYIMGANIGTTITAQIVALGGLSSESFPLTQILIALTLVGIIMTMFLEKKHPKAGYVGELISGLGLLFLGLEVMTDYMDEVFEANPQIMTFLANATNPLLLLLLGIVLTVIAQSSSAVTSIILALAISLASQGQEICGGGNGVLYLILGSNIGSTSTALISAIGSTTNGKRASVIHLLFNTFGSVIFFIILICWKDAFSMTFKAWFPNAPATQIAMFHTFFNVFCTLIFLPFTKMFVKLSELIVPDKKKKKTEEDISNELLDSRFLKTPGIALNQAVMYYHLMAKEAHEDLNLALDGFVNKNKKRKDEVDEKEARVLRMSRKLTGFIVEMTAEGLSESASRRVSKMQLDIADIVRLTEVADNITGYTRHEVDENLHFSDAIFPELQEMKVLLDQQFANVDKIVDAPSLSLLTKTRTMEDKIDDQRTAMIKGHMDRLSHGQCDPNSSDVFINLVGNLERCGDHLNFIAERACQELTSKGKEEDAPMHP